ncbi:FORKED 1 [Artemisia annua]|uniref:FORKED 1 n=1 Tax=Artemisia annua TaxID=35608 RepID=A0A2U1L733_ARTAN|nr:FORKED 1 [Artemisia annua]
MTNPDALKKEKKYNGRLPKGLFDYKFSGPTVESGGLGSSSLDEKLWELHCSPPKGLLSMFIPVFEMQKMLGSKMEMKKYEYCNKEIINYRFDKYLTRLSTFKRNLNTLSELAKNGGGCGRMLVLYVDLRVLNTRALKEVWNIEDIPVDREDRVNKNNGNFLGMCNQELLAEGSELLKRTHNGIYQTLFSFKIFHSQMFKINLTMGNSM